MTEKGRAEELLAERPDLESPLSAVLAVDEETDTWTFDDVPVESGAFGELVAHGVVERDGDEYCLADPEAVRRTLTDEPPSEPSTRADDMSPSVDFEFPDIDIDLRAAGLLGAALGLVALLRSYIYPSVFRNGDVVLSGNDPYFYLYWVEQSLATGGYASGLPGGILRGEPLLVATLALLTDLVGGVETADTILALYPVVAAVLCGILLYWLTIRLTGDRRIALTAVVFLAVMPGHALRTSIGFADHHAFDYVWLTLTAAALVSVVDVDTREDLVKRRTWLAALALGIGVGAQTLAWDSGPLLLLPIGVAIVVRTLHGVREGRSPLLINPPLLAGLGLGAVITASGHISLQWHTQVVAAAPALLLAGTAAVIGVGEVAHRLDRDALELAVAEGVVTLVGGYIVWTLLPEFRAELLGSLDRIFRSDDILEVKPLFGGGRFNFLLLFGLFLFVALPILVWGTRKALGNARWAVACSYGWYFFGLSLFQVRFTGQLGIFTAVFAATAFVFLAAKVDVTEHVSPFATGANRAVTSWTPGRPSASTVVAVFLLFALVGGLGFLQSAIKVQQIKAQDADYETATWLADYADRRGWDTPSESYVFTEWGVNRLYNYFVNGNSESYGYARSNYQPFMTQTDPETAKAMIGTRVRFIVTRGRDVPSDTMHARLHSNLGSRTDEVGGLGQFRAVYVKNRRAFVYVPGGNVSGTAPPNTVVDLSTDVDIPGASFTYRRRTETNGDGAYSVRVAYPGTYNVTTANATTTVPVPESAVMNGTTVDTTTTRNSR